MPHTVRQVRAEAEALAKTLGALPLAQLEGPVGDPVGRDYNRVRQAAVRLKPDLKGSLPPAFAVRLAGSGAATGPTCLDIMVYCGQVVMLLSSNRKPSLKPPAAAGAKPAKGKKGKPLNRRKKGEP
jgi:hypothetical protein